MSQVKLRCVGGPSDGKVVLVDEKMDRIRLPDPRGPILAAPTDVASTKIALTEYRVRRLRGPDGWVLEYLAPHDWTDAMAIEHQFAK